jgi:hypothetical protein
MDSFYSICWNEDSPKICSIRRAKPDEWLAASLSKFKPLFDLLSEHSVFYEFNILGNLSKGEKCVFLVMIREAIKVACENNTEYYQGWVHESPSIAQELYVEGKVVFEAVVKHRRLLKDFLLDAFDSKREFTSGQQVYEVGTFVRTVLDAALDGNISQDL